MRAGAGSLAKDTHARKHPRAAWDPSRSHSLCDSSLPGQARVRPWQLRHTRIFMRNVLQRTTTVSRTVVCSTSIVGAVLLFFVTFGNIFEENLLEARFEVLQKIFSSKKADTSFAKPCFPTDFMLHGNISDPSSRMFLTDSSLEDDGPIFDDIYHVKS